MMRAFIFVFSLSWIASYFGQSGTIAPKYSNEFLAIGVGADALGMGNAFVVGANGASSSYWNATGLLEVNKWAEVNLMHSEYFAGIANFDHVSIAHTIDEKSAAGFSLIRFGVDNIPNTTQLIDNNGILNYDNITSFNAGDYAFIGSYARSLNDRISIGGSTKVIYRHVGDFAKSYGFGFDIGGKYNVNQHVKLGFNFRDVTSTFNAWTFSLDEQTQETFLATGNELPENGLELTLPKLILGGLVQYPLFSSSFNFAAELNLDITTDGRRNVLLSMNPFSVDPHIGMSVAFKELILLRAGLSNVQFVENLNNQNTLNVQPSIGLGLALKGFYLDYAFTDIGDASIALYSHVISLRLKLDKPKNAVK